MGSDESQHRNTESRVKNGNRTRNYLAGLSSGYLFTFASVFVGLCLTPFILRYLDAEEYAIYALAGDLLLWLTLLDLGIGSGLKVQAAKLQLNRDAEELNRLTSAALAGQLITASAIVLAGALLAWGMPKVFDIREDMVHEASISVMMLALGTAITLSVQPFSAVLVARQQIHVENLLRLARVLLRAAATVVLLITGLGLLALPLANLGATLVTSALTVGYAHRAVATLRVGRRYFSWDGLLSITGLGVWFSLGSLAGLTIQHLDRVVTGRLVGLAVVTTLTLSGRLYVLSHTIVQQLVNNARPMIGELLGKGRTREAVLIYHQLFALSIGAAVVVAGTIWAGNDRFVDWWVGGQNYGGTHLDAALAANLVVHCWVLPNRALLAAGLIVKPQTLGRIVEGALNLTLSVFLGMRFGVVGIVAATAVAALLTSCWYLPWLTARHFNVPFWRLLWTDGSRSARVMVGIIPIAFAARRWSQGIDGLLGAATAMGATFATGSLLLWLFGLDDPTRARIRGILRASGLAMRSLPARAARAEVAK